MDFAAAVNLRELSSTAGRRFARFTTDVVTRRPALWPVFRSPLRKLFDRIAPEWDANVDPQGLAAYENALAAVTPAPRAAIDIGTGTGRGAFAIARRFPGADVVGVDLSEAMLAEARRKTPPELSGRVGFQQADASRLPFPDDSFDLVALANMIPFFDELARILRPGGSAVFGFSAGAETPIYVSPDRLRDELRGRGFREFADFSVGRATALLARRPEAA